MRRVMIIVAVLAALAGAAAYALTTDRPPAVAGEWERLPGAPLSKRERAFGVWTGREVLVFGGVDVPSCPNCSGEEPPVRLRDGAAYDPAARRWRRIADVPAGLEIATTAVAGGQLYVLSSKRPRAFLAYSIEQDRWRKVAWPPGTSAHFGLAAADDRLIAFSGRWTGRYDADARRWTQLPPVQANQVLWTGEWLVSLDCAPRPEKEGACLVTAAVLDGERWDPLPPSKINFIGTWAALDGLVVCPCLGDSNSQRQWVAEPAYPNGGILDVRRRRWSDLPDPPETTNYLWGGVVTARASAYHGSRGFVLDLDRGRWMRLPEHPHPSLHGETIVAAGRSLFTYGGTENLELTGGAYMWTPPRR